jgi:hypothetical protein
MPWETEEFVPLDDFDGTVTSSLWKPGVEGSTQLELGIQVHEVYAPEGAAAGETRAWYSIGKKGWDIVDGGLRVVPAQAGQKFHKSSKYGMLLDRVARELQLEQVISKGEPEEATIWIGERFRWERTIASYAGLTAAEGGEKRDVDTSILLPTEYRTAGVAPVAAAVAPSGISDADMAIIREVAKGQSTANKGQAVRLAIARDQRLNANAALMETLLQPDAIVELEAAGKLVAKDGVYV